MEVANLKDKILNFILNSVFFWAYKGNSKIKTYNNISNTYTLTKKRQGF